MPSFAKFAIAAAAVVVVALVGFNLIGGSTTSNVGGAASPSAAPPSPAALLPETDGVIPAGRYRWTSPKADVSFDVPDGWHGRAAETGYIETGGDSPEAYNLDFTTARYEDIFVYGDACKQGEPVAVGDTVDELVTALDDQKSTDVVVSGITAGSVTGKRVAMRQTPGLDRSQCTDGAQGPIRIWVNSVGNDYNAWAEDGQVVVYVFDVGGNRLVFTSGRSQDDTEANVEVDAIVESFEFSPN